MPDAWLQELMRKNPLVHWGIANPKGESNARNTTYFQEGQLLELRKKVVGLPVHIEHLTHKHGKNLKPCGRVVYGDVHPTTGQFWVGIVLSDDTNGKIAKALRGEIPGLPKEMIFNEMSIGYDVIQNPVTGQVVGNTATEISICPRGARDGTKFMSAQRLPELLERVNKLAREELPEVPKAGSSDTPCTPNKCMEGDTSMQKNSIAQSFTLPRTLLNQLPPNTTSFTTPTMSAPVFRGSNDPGFQDNVVKGPTPEFRDKRPVSTVMFGGGVPATVPSVAQPTVAVSVGASASMASTAAAAPVVQAPPAPTMIPKQNLVAVDGQTATPIAPAGGIDFAQAALDPNDPFHHMALLMQAAFPDGVENAAKRLPAAGAADDAEKSAKRQKVDTPVVTQPATAQPVRLGPTVRMEVDSPAQTPVSPNDTFEEAPLWKIADDATPAERAQIEALNQTIMKQNAKNRAFYESHRAALERERREFAQKVQVHLAPAIERMLETMDPLTATEASRDVREIMSTLGKGPSEQNRHLFNAMSVAASAFDQVSLHNKQNAVELENRYQREQQLTQLVVGLKQQFEAAREENARIRSTQARHLYSTPEDRIGSAASPAVPLVRASPPVYVPQPVVPAPTQTYVSIPAGASFSVGGSSKQVEREFRVLRQSHPHLPDEEIMRRATQQAEAWNKLKGPDDLAAFKPLAFKAPVNLLP